MEGKEKREYLTSFRVIPVGDTVTLEIHSQECHINSGCTHDHTFKLLPDQAARLSRQLCSATRYLEFMDWMSDHEDMMHGKGES